MRFISVRELNAHPKQVWAELKNGEMVVTSNGKPLALLSPVTEKTMEKTLKMIRRSRALMALEEMQKKSLAEGLDQLSDSEIEAEIRAVRKERRS
jgi:antitoxin (DNA-binding transcriptional repressor) of toxin-antitoxin stability system